MSLRDAFCVTNGLLFMTLVHCSVFRPRHCTLSCIAQTVAHRNKRDLQFSEHGFIHETSYPHRARFYVFPFFSLPKFLIIFLRLRIRLSTSPRGVLFGGGVRIRSHAHFGVFGMAISSRRRMGFSLSAHFSYLPHFQRGFGGVGKTRQRHHFRWWWDVDRRTRRIYATAGWNAQ